MDTQAQTQLDTGMTIFGADGEKVGKVGAVENGYVVVEKGFFFPTDYYIPTSAITSTDGDSVYLNVTKAQALDQQAWTSPPTGGYEETDTVVATETTGYDDRAQTGATTYAEGAEAIHVPVYEEELSAVKRDVDRGAVRIEKDVFSEERSIDVPVMEERVRVSRVEGVTGATVGADAFQEGVIEVPVRGQEVELEKTARVAGEVVVEKEAVQRTERASGTVRREEVRVDDQSVQAVDDVTTGTTSGTGNRPSRSERRRNR